MHFKVRHFVTWRHLIVKNVDKTIVAIFTNRILGTATSHEMAKAPIRHW